MTTPLFLLRCVQIGLSISELDLLTIGTVNDMYAEMSNDDFNYPALATQEQMDQMRSSGKAFTTADYLPDIDITNNLQELIAANLVTTGDMDTITVDPSGNGEVEPGSLYVTNDLQAMTEAAQNMSVFDQITYADAVEIHSEEQSQAASADISGFAGLIVTNPLQELIAATSGTE